MTLLDRIGEMEKQKNAPLAERMKPVTIDDFIGQDDVLGEGTLLRRMIKADQLRSIILYGPTGVGKTSIARIIANATKSRFISINAVTSGIKDIKQAVEQAEYEQLSGTKTVLFIDEIHRFNKAQQDALLPFVENGTIILIGATTENPYFEVNGALVSRTLIFRLQPLSQVELVALIRRAIVDRRGLADLNPKVSDEAITYLAEFCYGDARKALNALELAVLSTDPDDAGDIVIDRAVIAASFQRKDIRYDKNGDQHYDVISAFIKSMRGSDPDAAIHYLARMLAAGEDPMFIARRVVIAASEDVGNANPNALVLANAAMQAVSLIGMPEARIALAQAVTYIACSPKSNRAYLAINQALADVEKLDIGVVPPHLRDSSYKAAKKFGHGVSYKYPHNFDDAFVAQQYLPDALLGKTYYEPSERGTEKRLKQHLDFLSKK